MFLSLNTDLDQLYLYWVWYSLSCISSLHFTALSLGFHEQSYRRPVICRARRYHNIIIMADLNVSKFFECDIYKWKFMWKYDLSKHMLFHDHGQRHEFNCSQCRKKYTSRKNLNRHFKESHQQRSTWWVSIYRNGKKTFIKISKTHVSVEGGAWCLLFSHTHSFIQFIPVRYWTMQVNPN